MLEHHSIAIVAFHGATWTLWLLCALAVVGLCVAIERAIVFSSSRDDFVRLRSDVVRLLRRGDRVAALRCLEASPSYEARVAAAALGADSSASARERMAGEQQLARLNMEHNIALLSALASKAPWIGLLGTLIGVVGALHGIDRTLASSWAVFAANVGEALLASAAGVVVALLSMAPCELFRQVIAIRVGRADALGREVLAHFEDVGGAS